MTLENSQARSHALTILHALLKDQVSLSLGTRSKEVSPMTKDLCFGFCRHYFRLQAIALSMLKKKPKDQLIWIVLLMGLYQLMYSKAPDYAVVKETVALLEKVKKIWAKSLVNALLRNFCRKKEDILSALANHEGYVYGQPPALLQAWKKDWPHDWQNIAYANDRHPPMTLRVNRRKNSVSEYLQSLQEAGIEARRHEVAPEGIDLKMPCDVYSLPGFAEGCVSVQDGAAQLAVSLLSLQPGLRVLDACCAPGGKTCHILESEPHLKACLALDIDHKRLQRVRENLERLQLKATLLEGDALSPEVWWDGKCFDRILLDAPCSATGVIRRHSDIKLLRTEAEIASVIKIQQDMLQALWPLLSPGGLMVYATCSILFQENEEQMVHFAQSHPDCRWEKNRQAWGRKTGHGRQILPGDQGMDGFFYSVLLKI